MKKQKPVGTTLKIGVWAMSLQAYSVLRSGLTCRLQVMEEWRVIYSSLTGRKVKLVSTSRAKKASSTCRSP